MPNKGLLEVCPGGTYLAAQSSWVTNSAYYILSSAAPRSPALLYRCFMVGWRWKDGEVEAASATNRDDRLAPRSATDSFARGPDAGSRYGYGPGNPVRLYSSLMWFTTKQDGDTNIRHI